MDLFVCVLTTTKHGRDKFQDRAKVCVLKGYPFGKKGYRAMDLTTSKFYESRDIVFHENIFPFAISAKDRTTSFMLNPIQNVDVVDDETNQAVTQNFVTNSVQFIPVEIPHPL